MMATPTIHSTPSEDDDSTTSPPSESLSPARRLALPSAIDTTHAMTILTTTSELQHHAMMPSLADHPEESQERDDEVHCLDG